MIDSSLISMICKSIIILWFSIKVCMRGMQMKSDTLLVKLLTIDRDESNR